MAYNIGKPVPTRKPLNLSSIKDMWRDKPVDLTGIRGMWDDATQQAIAGQKPAPAPAPGKGGTLTKLFTEASPYMSNIINSFRKPPMPKKGEQYRYTPLQKVNLSDERNKVSTMYQAANRNTERNVDSNTAEAIKAFNRGDEISKLSSINERENNMNVGISNQQAQMDAATSAANTGLENKYRDEMVERQVANQREQSANVANAGDKMMMIRNERSKERTELGKARVLRGLYEKSGVLKRDNAIGQQWKATGVPDPFGEDYKWLEPEKKANGGTIFNIGIYKDGKFRPAMMGMGGRIPQRKIC